MQRGRQWAPEGPPALLLSLGAGHGQIARGRVIIPDMIEGYPVHLPESGETGPLGGGWRPGPSQHDNETSPARLRIFDVYDFQLTR
jgi:hypothetical protein